MHSQGFLPQDWRYYIAIMAVSCYGCEQLYELLVNQFLLIEGEIAWIEVGMEAIPVKLRNLVYLCKTLAFKPWEFALETLLGNLIKPENQENRWMKKDLVHALCIFIFYNCLASYSMANGVCNEADLTGNGPSQ